MNKFVFALTTVLFSTQVFAAATLHIPVILVDDSNGKMATVKALNAKLAAAGQPTLPEYFDVSTGDNGHKKVKEIQAKVDKALQALGLSTDEIRLEGGYVPTSADIKPNVTCYTGNPAEVSDIVGGLTDIFYSDQLNMFAEKYKNTVTALDGNMDLNDQDTQDFLSESALWKNWTGQGEDLLILSSISDGGDDVQESLIKYCGK